MRIERAVAVALLVAACACREEPPPAVGPGRILRARRDAARSLLALLPDHARSGEVFQAQPGGNAGLALLGTGFSRRDVVSWDGHPLETYFANSRLLTVVVPPELLARPGEVEVTVESPADAELSKLHAVFRLEPAGARPAI